MDVHFFDRYLILMEFISKTIGPDYEVTLIDTSGETSKVIAIVNGHISGRKVGQGISALVEKSIEDEEYKHSDYIINRTSYSKTGKALRTSMYFIKDDEDNLVGILKINFDDSRFSNISESVLSLCHPDSYFTDNEDLDDQTKDAGSFSIVKEEKASSTSPLERLIDSVLSQVVIPVDRLNQEEKLQIIQALDERGAFMFKGAVSEVADRLDSSIPSIYRYLNMVRS